MGRLIFEQLREKPAQWLIAGLTTAFSGEHRATLTEQLLQTTGMSAQTAGMIDSGISIVGSIGSIAIIRANQWITFPRYSLPVHVHDLSISCLSWV